MFVVVVGDTGMVTFSAFIEVPTVTSFTSLRVFSLGEVLGEEDDLKVILDTFEPPAEVGVSMEFEEAEFGVEDELGVELTECCCEELTLTEAVEPRFKLAGFDGATEIAVRFGLLLFTLAVTLLEVVEVDGCTCVDVVALNCCVASTD